MKYLTQYKTIAYSAFLSLFFVLPSWAQGSLKNANDHLKKAADKAGTTEGDISNIVGIAINAMLTLVGLFFLILMVYAGYLWMTARGESDPVEKAKRIIAGALVGLVIVLSAYAITAFVMAGLSN